MKSNVSALEGYEFFFGKGTGASSFDRLEEYMNNNLNYAVEEDYNAHNMFVEILYYFLEIFLTIKIPHFYLVNAYKI